MLLVLSELSSFHKRQIMLSLTKSYVRFSHESSKAILRVIPLTLFSQCQVCYFLICIWMQEWVLTQSEVHQLCGSYNSHCFILTEYHGEALSQPCQLYIRVMGEGCDGVYKQRQMSQRKKTNKVKIYIIFVSSHLSSFTLISHREAQKPRKIHLVTLSWTSDELPLCILLIPISFFFLDGEQLEQNSVCY